MLEGLLEEAVLVHVDRLHVLATGEDHGVVLILGLALTEHGVPGEADRVDLLNTGAILAWLAILCGLDEHRVELRAPIATTRLVNIGHAKVRVLLQQVVDVLRLGVVAGGWLGSKRRVTWTGCTKLETAGDS